jgi:DNA invertase Pin-like site-specific DNA recombinase
MKKQNEKIIYGAYYRKSSEDSERQINSISDQQRELDAIELKEKINVKIKFPGESQSAFSPGRPIFAELIKSIETGKINAVFVWNANRLARNPVDSGWLIHLMDTGKLKEVKTPTRVYYNNGSDKFILGLDFGISKKDSDDKSVVVKRALEGRALRGLPNGMSKIGFSNDTTEEKGNRKWVVDPIRFPLMQKLFQKMLTGKYSVPQLHKYAKDELKLTTSLRKKEGGKPISLSYIYTLFRDPIHAGFFFHNEIRCELDLRLPRAINEDEYWKIQSMMGNKGVKRTTKRESVYNHFTKCGTCNGATFPDFKFQIICSECHKKFSYLNKESCPKCGIKIVDMIDPSYLSYIFYYCINDKKHRTVCPKNGIEERNLENDLIKNLDEKVSISKELSKWCIDNIYKIKDKELEEQLSIKNNFESQELSLKTKLKRITINRISRDVSQEEEQTYLEIENGIRDELNQLNIQKNNTNVDWFSEASKDFDIMTEVVDILKNGSVEQKKNTLIAFGSNLSIKDKVVSVYNKKSIEKFSEFLQMAKSENKAFEPKTSLATKEKTEVFASVIPTLLRG